MSATRDKVHEIHGEDTDAIREEIERAIDDTDFTARVGEGARVEIACCDVVTAFPTLGALHGEDADEALEALLDEIGTIYRVYPASGDASARLCAALAVQSASTALASVSSKSIPRA